MALCVATSGLPCNFVHENTPPCFGRVVKASTFPDEAMTAGTGNALQPDTRNNVGSSPCKLHSRNPRPPS